MDRTEAGERELHVSRTRRFLEHEAQLDRLLALTCGRAEAGRAAFELVAPLLSRRPTDWAQLAGTGLAPAAVLAAVEHAAQAFERVDDWSAAPLEQALDALSQSLHIPRHSLDAVLAVFVLNGHTPLPATAVFEVLGRAECRTRLRAATRAYRAGLLVG